MELNYFKLALISFLKESHPELSKDQNFIASRSDIAAEVYSEAVKAGRSHVEAQELSDERLYEGLHFSLYNTLVNIIWREFFNEIPEDEAKEVALKVLPLCYDVAAKYSLTDDFADSSLFELLYTELAGTISIYLEKHGLQ